MKDKIEQLLYSLQKEDKENALALCMNYLEKDNLSIIDLYEDILVPALNNIIHEYSDDEDLIWKEHVRSSIIRSIIECSYPYVLREKKNLGHQDKGKVIVMCPRYEDHELGARMVSDIFTIAGYQSSFIGANTPEKTVLRAVESIQPEYIAISVTNYYNLVATKKTIEKIKAANDRPIKFILGGNAFTAQEDSYKETGGDYLFVKLQDIMHFDEGGGGQ